MYDTGLGRGGLSGVHPFLMVETKKARRYIGIYLRNSAAMTPIIRFNPDGTSTLSLITIGGQIEFYVIGMGTAHQVIQYYQSMVISKAQLPPYWSLGWQEASPNPVQGKTEQDSLIQAVNNYVTNKFPLEAVYLQQDSWDGTKDFTLD
jgi:alpha-glucosidase (family GH31 glycosyl hydrolase)